MPVDVKENGREYVAFFDLPGIDEDELHFEAGTTSLRVYVARDFDHDQEDAEEFIRLERPFGHFEATLSFANPVRLDHLTAKYRRGVLKVRVPKQPHQEKP